jgi:hypothetical protein
MPKRTVKTGLATYVNAKGQAGSVGFQGEEIDVHPDDVERFDALNEQPGGDDPHEPRRESVDLLSSPAAGPDTSGTGSGLNTAVDDSDDAKPKPRARKAADK